MNIFLKAKHWQLFLLNFGIPFFLYIAISIVMIGDILGHDNAGPDMVFSYMPIFFVLGFFANLIQYGWTWSVAIKMNRIIPEEFKLNTMAFKIFFWLPLIYFPIFAIFFILMFRSIDSITMSFLLLIPVHLFMVFCAFYCIYFTARVVKTAEYKRYTTVSDYIAEFIMIWFFPIGIWFIQPKINKMYEEYQDQLQGT